MNYFHSFQYSKFISQPKEYAVKSFTEQIKHNYGQRSDDKKNSGVSPATSAIDKIQEKVNTYIHALYT